MQEYSSIHTKDGTAIGITTYLPEQSAGKLMIVAATGGVNQKMYQPFSEFFRKQGYTVITFDYRGIGRSAPDELNGYQATMHQWAVQDIDAVILHAKTHYPLQEIIYVGHCVGGEIVGLARASQYISKLVMVNSALSCKKLWPIKYRFKIVTLKKVVKLMNKWFGFYPGKKMGYGEDLPADVIYEWSGWCSNSNGLFDKFPDNNYRKLQVPLLAFSFTDNWNTPRKAVKELLNRFSSAFITWHHLTPEQLGVEKIGHYGFFYAPRQADLWMSLLDWIIQTDRLKEPA